MRQVCSSGAAEKPPEINEEQVKGLHGKQCALEHEALSTRELATKYADK